MKRIGFLLLGLALAATVAGCGGSNAPVQSTSPPAEPLEQPLAGTEPPPTGEPLAQVVTPPPPASTEPPQPTGEPPVQTAPPTPQAGMSDLPPLPDGENFELSSINSISPEDALIEMYAFGKGGPGDEGECVSSPPETLAEYRLMAPFHLAVCWPEDEPVTLRAVRPDGQSETTVLQPKNGEVMVRYQPRYDNPPGEYALSLSGASQTFDIRVRFIEPDHARILEVPASPFEPVESTNGPRHNLILDHFVAGERAWLFAFAGDQMIGWQEVVIREDGRLPVNVNLEGMDANEKVSFAVVGEQNGQVDYGGMEVYGYFGDYNVRLCPGAKRSRLVACPLAPIPARVAYVDGKKLIVHGSPGFDTPAVALIPEGTEISVQRPTCTDQTWFWEVYDFASGRATGWVAEAKDGVYLIEPWE